MNHKLFRYSSLIVLFTAISIIWRSYKIYSGYEIDSNVIPIVISISVTASMFAEQNKNWKLGLLFILISSVFMHLSVFVGESSINKSLFMNFVALIILALAVIPFMKLRD